MTGPEFATVLLWGVPTVCLVALVGYALTAYLDRLADARESRPESDPAKVAATRAEVSAATVAHIGLCGVQRAGLTCTRALGHVDHHGDWSQASERPITWPNEDAGLERLLRAVDGDGAA